MTRRLMVYAAMAYIVMACMAMAYIVMACMAMAYIVMAYIDMAGVGHSLTLLPESRTLRPDFDNKTAASTSTTRLPLHTTLSPCSHVRAPMWGRVLTPMWGRVLTPMWGRVLTPMWGRVLTPMWDRVLTQMWDRALPRARACACVRANRTTRGLPSG